MKPVICIWNSKGKRFTPSRFTHWQNPGNPFMVNFTATYEYVGKITQWGWHCEITGKEHRQPLNVEYPGWLGGTLTLNSSIGII